MDEDKLNTRNIFETSSQTRYDDHRNDNLAGVMPLKPIQTCSIFQSNSRLVDLTRCMLGYFLCFLSSADFTVSKTYFLKQNITGIPSDCQTVWKQIRVAQIWVQTVYLGYQQTALVYKG